MKHVSIIIPQGPIILSSVIGTYKVFSFVNGFMEAQGKKPAFDIHLVGLSKETELYDGLFAIRPDMKVDEVPKTDLIMIPAFYGNPMEGLERNMAFVPWITDQYKHGAEVASLCTGAFLLASTNLLKGKACTTHWMAADIFRQALSKSKPMPENLIMDELGIFST